MVKWYHSSDPMVPGYLNPWQGEFLGTFAAAVPQGGHVVEIGSLLGKSARWLALGCMMADAKLTCIDPWTGNEDDNQISKLSGMMQGNGQNIFQAFINQSLLGEDWVWRRINMIQGYSTEVRKRFKKRSIDLLYIDGNHSKAIQDYEAYRDRMTPHGLIILDDVTPQATELYGICSPLACVHQMHREGWKSIGGIVNAQAFTRDPEWWAKALSESIHAMAGYSWQHLIRDRGSMAATDNLGPSPIPHPDPDHAGGSKGEKG